MAQVQRGCPLELIFEQGRDLNQQVQGGAENYTIDETLNAKTRREIDRTDDLTNVIHGWRQSGEQEVLVGLQACHHQTTDRKDYRADEIQPHQLSKQLTLFCTKARRDPKFGID